MKTDRVRGQNISKTTGMSEHKKILYLMEYPIDLIGGAQLSTQVLCAGISAYGDSKQSEYAFESVDTSLLFETVVVCPGLLSKMAEDYPFRIVSYPADENRERSRIRRIKNFLTRIGHFKRIIKSEKPDLIHVSMPESLLSYGVLRCLGFFANIPFLYTDRGLCDSYKKRSKRLIKKTLKHAERLVTTTQFNKEKWEMEGVSCEISVVPNALTSAFDQYEPKKHASIREKYGISEGELVIGFAGRISEEKDWALLPKLVKLLHERGLSFTVFLVLSSYEKRDEAIALKLQEEIRSVIGQSKLIYQQNLSQEEMADYYYMLDLFVLTSRIESFGKTAVEAMSRKCAVLATAVGGLPEVLGRDENLYDKSNLDLFAERVTELSQDASKLMAEKELFYDRYKRLYRKETNVSRYLDIYREILMQS